MSRNIKKKDKDKMTEIKKYQETLKRRIKIK
jgi:hypothetical protein